MSREVGHGGGLSGVPGICLIPSPELNKYAYSLRRQSGRNLDCLPGGGLGRLALVPSKKRHLRTSISARAWDPSKWGGHMGTD